jgi:hypothetical protein
VSSSGEGAPGTAAAALRALLWAACQGARSINDTCQVSAPAGEVPSAAMWRRACVQTRGAKSRRLLATSRSLHKVPPSQALCWGHCMQVCECRLRRRLAACTAAWQPDRRCADLTLLPPAFSCRTDGPRVAGVRGRAPLRRCGACPPPGVSRSSTAGPCPVACLACPPPRRDSAPGVRSMS